VTEGSIRPIAICVVRRDQAILVFDAHDPDRDRTYHRPLGGGLLFGESSEEAVRRELLEEIGAELTDLQLLGVIENRFDLAGVPAHEIVFVYEGGFVDRSLYQKEAFVVVEENETLTGGWVPLTAFDMTTRPLYPTGLLDLLTGDP
jgi:ADP-ribose pyrophosphatase YjhB (NUDIX family)